jgi:hypothetical protein
MHERFFPSESEYDPFRFRARARAYPTHIRQIEAERAVFRACQRLQLFKRFLRWVVRLWPVAAGLLLGLVAPQLRALLFRFEPWAAGVVFPFAALARRPELHMGARLAGSLPLLFLYAQFPVEGLVARIAVRRRVSVAGVAGQVFYFHFLGALQLLMVSGAVGRILAR